MISAVIHTFNEEKNIVRCLLSLKDWVDEIILVDMNSTDGTREKAREFTKKIYTHPHLGFADPARNFSIEKASGDWILMIDADEEVSKELKSILLKIAKTSNKSYFRLPRKNIIFGNWIKHTRWWPDYQIRFFRKGNVSWSDRIHGVPITRGEGFDLEASEQNALIHYNYQSIDQFLERLNRYTSIQSKELYISGTKFQWTDLIRKPMSEFLGRFFEGEGFKDGVHGLVLSLLQSVYMFVVYVKLWELEGFTKGHIDLVELEKELSERSRQEQYWLVEKKLQYKNSAIDSLKLKLKRKVLSNG